MGQQQLIALGIGALALFFGLFVVAFISIKKKRVDAEKAAAAKNRPPKQAPAKAGAPPTKGDDKKKPDDRKGAPVKGAPPEKEKPGFKSKKDRKKRRHDDVEESTGTGRVLNRGKEGAKAEEPILGAAASAAATTVPPRLSTPVRTGEVPEYQGDDDSVPDLRWDYKTAEREDEEDSAPSYSKPAASYSADADSEDALNFGVDSLEDMSTSDEQLGQATTVIRTSDLFGKTGAAQGTMDKGKIPSESLELNLNDLADVISAAEEVDEEVEVGSALEAEDEDGDEIDLEALADAVNSGLDTEEADIIDQIEAQVEEDSTPATFDEDEEAEAELHRKFAEAAQDEDDDLDINPDEAADAQALLDELYHAAGGEEETSPDARVEDENNNELIALLDDFQGIDDIAEVVETDDSEYGTRIHEGEEEDDSVSFNSAFLQEEEAEDEPEASAEEEVHAEETSEEDALFDEEEESSFPVDDEEAEVMVALDDDDEDLKLEQDDDDLDLNQLLDEEEDLELESAKDTKSQDVNLVDFLSADEPDAIQLSDNGIFGNDWLSEVLDEAQTNKKEKKAAKLTTSQVVAADDKEKKMQDKARRLARTIARDIKNYNGDKLQAGIDGGSISATLSSEIEKAKSYYLDEAPKGLKDPLRFFHEGLVEVLAEGDASLIDEF